MPQPSYVSVHGLGAPLPQAMATKIEHDLAPALNAGLDPDEMATRLLAIAGTDRYEYLTYGLTDRPKPHGLLIGVRQKSYGPPFLMLGLELNNVDSTNFAFNLSTRVLQYGLLGMRSTAAGFGSTSRSGRSSRRSSYAWLRSETIGSIRAARRAGR